MPMIIPQTPDAALAALDKALPRYADVASALVAEGTGLADASFRAHVSARPSIALRAPGIARGVEDFVAKRRLSGIGAKAVGDPHRPLAAQVHVMGLDDLVARKSPRKMAPALWTHFLGEAADGTQAMADVDAKTFKFTQVLEGPGVPLMRKRIAGLATLEDASGKASELAMIQVPALHLTALWLKAASGEADDVVIPNEGPIAPLVPGKRYALAEFQSVTAKMAAERLEMAKGDSGG